MTYPTVIVKLQVNDPDTPDRYLLQVEDQAYDLLLLLQDLSEEDLQLLQEAIDRVSPPTAATGG